MSAATNDPRDEYTYETSSEIRSKTSKPTVVVAIDGSDNSWRALEWAAFRAYATDSPLRILHAFRLPVYFDPYGVTIWWDERSVECGQHLLESAVARVKYTNPAVDVTTRLVTANPAPGILRESKDAGLIVLGRSRPRNWLANRMWSVSSEVARHAPGKVVLVDSDNEVLV